MVAQITQNHWKLLVKKVPQGSVVTYLRYSGISNEDFITNILLRLKVKDSGNGSAFSKFIDEWQWHRFSLSGHCTTLYDRSANQIFNITLNKKCFCFHNVGNCSDLTSDGRTQHFKETIQSQLPSAQFSYISLCSVYM